MTAQDKAEIVEIVNLYGLALGAHRWDLSDLVFTDDVIAEFDRTLDSHQHTMMGQVVNRPHRNSQRIPHGRLTSSQFPRRFRRWGLGSAVSPRMATQAWCARR